MSQCGVPHDVVEYPCSDGKPMAESDIHLACMKYVLDALKWRYERRGQADVYVSADSFVYYERGNPRAVVAPDVYVVVGAPGHLRDSYLLWNEPKGPDFVLEVTSASTRREDEKRKREVYASLGVAEYFLYDPRGEYLTPPLHGYRLRDGEYRPLPAVTVLPSRGVMVHSEVLGLDLRDEREDRMLRLGGLPKRAQRTWKLASGTWRAPWHRRQHRQHRKARDPGSPRGRHTEVWSIHEPAPLGPAPESTPNHGGVEHP